MNLMNLAEQAKWVEGLPPAADASGRAGDYVSLKHYEGVWVVVHINQGHAATVALTPFQASAVAGTGEKAIPAVAIWANEDCVTSDALVRQTDAANFTTSAAVKDKVVMFYIPATALDVAGGFDCVCVKTGASNAANITEASYILVGSRYAQATPPSAIVD
jgi:hypothetical protein